jgi:hypothetical protein
MKASMQEAFQTTVTSIVTSCSLLQVNASTAPVAVALGALSVSRVSSPRLSGLSAMEGFNRSCNKVTPYWRISCRSCSEQRKGARMCRACILLHFCPLSFWPLTAGAIKASFCPAVWPRSEPPWGRAAVWAPLCLSSASGASWGGWEPAWCPSTMCGRTAPRGPCSRSSRKRSWEQVGGVERVCVRFDCEKPGMSVLHERVQNGPSTREERSSQCIACNGVKLITQATIQAGRGARPETSRLTAYKCWILGADLTDGSSQNG